MVKIQKINPTTTVSPSSTASRMGVVDVSVPSISKITDPIADSLNMIGEAQAKLFDTKWLNDYEFNTGMFINNKVDSILASGEMPNLEEFTAEMSAYNEGILKEAPERLKLAAEGYFNSKFITSFGILKDQTNALTFADAELNFTTWQNNIVTDFENDLLKITMTAPDPLSAMESIHELSGTTITNLLEGHTERYSALFPFSNGKYNESTLKASELGILINVEVARNNAILRSFYQNIDINDPAEVGAADEAANLWISNYLKNEGNTRGLNYDVFTDATGTNVGEKTVNDIIDLNQQYLGQLRSVNTTKAVKEEGYNKLQAKAEYNAAYDNLTNYSYWNTNSYFLKSVPEGVPGQESTKAWTLQDFETAFAGKFSDTEILNLFNANQEKLFIKEYYDQAIRNTDNREVSFRSLSSSSMFNQMITASEDELMQGYFQYRFGDDYMDSPDYYDKLDPRTLEQINDVYRQETYVPEGMQQFLNTVNMANIEDMRSEDVSGILINRLGTYRNLTSDGSETFNIDTDIAVMFDDMLMLQKKGFNIQQIKDYLVKKTKYTKEDLNTINDRNETFLKNLIENPDKSFQEYFVDYYVQTQKSRRDTIEVEGFGSDGITQYRAGTDVGSPTTENSLIEELEAEALVIYNKSSYTIDALIKNNTLEFMNLLSGKDTNNEKQQLMFEKSIKYAMNGAKKANFGTSEFADNLPGSSYVYLPIEQQHKNLSTGVIRDSLTSYVYNNITNILEDENNELYNEVANQFTFAGNVEKPTHKEIKELIEQGNIYVTAVQNNLTGQDTMYEVHIANSGSKFDEPYGYDTLNHLTFDGAYFNPTIYTAGGIITKEFIQEVIDGNIVLNDNGTIEFGELPTRLIIPNIAVNTSMFDVIEQKYYAPLKRALTIGSDNVDKIYSDVLQDIYTGEVVEFQELGKE